MKKLEMSYPFFPNNIHPEQRSHVETRVLAYLFAAQGFIHSRNDWLYGHDVTLG